MRVRVRVRVNTITARGFDFADPLTALSRIVLCRAEQALRALMMLQSVVVAALHGVVGTEVGARTLERVCDRLKTHAKFGDSDVRALLHPSLVAFLHPLTCCFLAA